MTSSPSPAAQPPPGPNGLEQLFNWAGQAQKNVIQFFHDDAWLHTIWDGSLGSLVGAGVALSVVFFTVGAQKRGIAEQLSAQASGLAAQLSAQASALEAQLAEQRHENAKDREHAAGAHILQALQGLPSIVSMDKTQAFDGQMLARFSEVRSGFERLRLELKVGDDAVITELHTWATLIQMSGYKMHSFARDAEKDPSIRPEMEAKTRREQILVACSTEFLLISVGGYIRSGEEGRLKMAAYLRKAREELAKSPKVEEWADKYFRPDEKPVFTE